MSASKKTASCLSVMISSGLLFAGATLIGSETRTLDETEMSRLRGGELGYCCGYEEDCYLEDKCDEHIAPGCSQYAEHWNDASGNHDACVDGYPSDVCTESSAQPTSCNWIYYCKDPNGGEGNCEREEHEGDYIYGAVDCGPDYCEE